MYLQMGKMIIQSLFNNLKNKYNAEIDDYNHHFAFCSSLYIKMVVTGFVTTILIKRHLNNNRLNLLRY